jgi:hypothetical protein
VNANTKLALVAFGIVGGLAVLVLIVALVASQGGDTRPGVEVGSGVPRKATEAAGALAYAACIMVLGLAYLALLILVAAWVARDAYARGHEGAVWAVSFLVLQWAVLVVYLLARRQGELILCDTCGGKHLTYARRCPHCNAVEEEASEIVPPPVRRRITSP